MNNYVNEKAETYKKFLCGKRACVIGAGISNIPLIRFLLEHKATVTVRDKKSREELLLNPDLRLEALENEGVKFILGPDYLRGIDADIVYKTPGVRFDHVEILEAYDNGAYITGEMEAFLSICPCKVIAITGSNGKTTTSTLCAKLLEAAGHRVFLGGNIGTPLLAKIDEITPDDFVVVELSSFQLHTVNRFDNKGLPFAHISFPDVAIITNVSPNHLDWHTSMTEYAESKRAVFDFMPDGGRFVTNADCAITAEFASAAAGRNVDILTFSRKGEPGSSIFLRDGEIVMRENGREKSLIAVSEIKIPGLHNAENYMAAYAATEPFITEEAFLKVAREFPGVPYRLEFVREKDGVKYYDSSIDSSPSRTEAALSAFPKSMEKKINIILGGYDKKIPFEPLAAPVCRTVKNAYITGHTAKKIEDAIKNSECYDPETTHLYMCSDFENAVRCAAADAESGEVVLLSPACASFDAFKNFEERGKRFKEIVKSL